MMRFGKPLGRNCAPYPFLARQIINDLANRRELNSKARAGASPAAAEQSNICIIESSRFVARDSIAKRNQFVFESLTERVHLDRMNRAFWRIVLGEMSRFFKRPDRNRIGAVMSETIHFSGLQRIHMLPRAQLVPTI